MKRPVELHAYRDLVESASKILSPYMLGFVKLSMVNEQADASIGGSGTLASIDGINGVLTAAHVVDSLRKDDEAGVVFATQSVQRLIFKTEYCRSFTARGSDPSSGPDIGFIVLPPDTTSALQAKMSFYNLSRHADRMLSNSPPLRDGFWGLTGFAEEHTTESEPPVGFSRAKMFKGGFGAGVVTGANERGEFDYITYEALYNEYYEGPESFGGFSGGGLWQLTVNLKEDPPQIREKLLQGVAFHQSDKLLGNEGETRDITCHGRRSVYHWLLEKVRAAECK